MAEVAVIEKVTEYALENPEGLATWSTRYAAATIQGYKDLFGGADKPEDRHRSLQLTLINATDHDIILQDHIFESGTWVYSFPARIAARQAVTGFVANSQGSILTGVSGGFAFRVEGQNLSFGLGFTNPQFGGYKTSIILRRNINGLATAAYDTAQNNYPKLESMDGFELQVRQVESKYAQMGQLFTFSKLKSKL